MRKLLHSWNGPGVRLNITIVVVGGGRCNQDKGSDDNYNKVYRTVQFPY